MDRNFKLSLIQPLSKQCIAIGLKDFEAVFNYIKQLSYGRNSDRSDYTLVINENKGTCSTKHAFLKAIAIENNVEDLKLFIGIFKMNVDNTPKIKSILSEHHLTYIPEAHCYLKQNEVILDITFNKQNHSPFSETLLHEETILPKQIGDYKLALHKSYLKSWIEREQLFISFEDLWTIREACIHKISE